MRTQQELTALGEVLNTYAYTPPSPSLFACLGSALLGLVLLLLALIPGLTWLALLALPPLAYGAFLWRKRQQAPPKLSIALHQKGVNPIYGPYNKAWLFEDIAYNYLFHTGAVNEDQPYNNLALRRNDTTPWFVIPAHMPQFADFLQRYQTLYYEHRFPNLLKKIMLGKTVAFQYVVEDAVLVRALIDQTFDTPTKTLTLSQTHITIDGVAHALADLNLKVIDKRKTYIALTDQNGQLILGNDHMGVFNHVLFIDLLTHLMAVQRDA